MSRYSYAGNFRNPTEDFTVVENPNGEGYIIGVRMTVDQILDMVIHDEINAQEAIILRNRGWRPHTNGAVFEDDADAIEWIEGVAEAFEEDYEDYLEENRYDLARMEQAEAFWNER